MKHYIRSFVFVLAAGLCSPFVSAATIDFSNTGTNLYGDTAGDTIGDIVITQDGITMSVETFSFASFTDFHEAHIDGVNADVFSTPSLEMNNISGLFDFSGVGFEVGQVTFEYFLFGPAINFAVNGGTIFEFDTFVGLPQDPIAISPGVFVIVEPGLVTLNGPVDSFLVGGQEVRIDNVTATPVPEPTTIALFCCGLVFLGCQRYRRSATA